MSSAFSITRFNFFCLHVSLTRASLLALAKSIYYTYFSPSVPSFVLCRGTSSRSIFVEITRIGFISYRCVYNFLIPLLQITDCIFKTHGNPYPQQRMNELFVAVYNLKQTQLLTKNVQKSEKHVFISENCLSLG